jgi:hypothetical protein
MNLCGNPDMRVEEKGDCFAVNANETPCRNQRMLSLADECWKFEATGTGIRAEMSSVQYEMAREENPSEMSDGRSPERRQEATQKPASENKVKEF